MEAMKWVGESERERANEREQKKNGEQERRKKRICKKKYDKINSTENKEEKNGKPERQRGMRWKNNLFYTRMTSVCVCLYAKFTEAFV